MSAHRMARATFARRAATVLAGATLTGLIVLVSGGRAASAHPVHPSPAPVSIVLDTTSMPGMTMTRTVTPSPAPASIVLDTTSMPGMTMTRTVGPGAPGPSDGTGSSRPTAAVLGGFAAVNAGAMVAAWRLRRRGRRGSRDGPTRRTANRVH